MIKIIINSTQYRSVGISTTCTRSHGASHGSLRKRYYSGLCGNRSLCCSVTNARRIMAFIYTLSGNNAMLH